MSKIFFQKKIIIRTKKGFLEKKRKKTSEVLPLVKFEKIGVFRFGGCGTSLQFPLYSRNYYKNPLHGGLG